MKLVFVLVAWLIAVGASAQTNCARTPAFALKAGYTSPILSTSDRMRGGMVLLKQGPNGAMIEPYQHPSWRRAGRLGGFVVTEKGEIFVVPVPNVNTLENPPERQNTLQRVDPLTGEMADFISIPVAAAPSEKNPYGLVGIAYDCKRKLLYVSTLSGSTVNGELGKIVAISLEKLVVHDELSGLDAIGVGVFDDGKRHFMLAGSARNSSVFKIELDAKGQFASSATFALKLDPLNVLRARKIRFVGQEALFDATEFYYNLVAQTEFESVSRVISITSIP